MKRTIRHFTILSCLAGVSYLNGQERPAAAVVAPPSLLAPQRIMVPCQGPRGAVVDFAVATKDAAETNPSIECRPPSGSVFPVGTNTVACVGTDAAGNQVGTAFPVIVMGGCATDDCIELKVPEDIDARCNSKGGAPVEFNVTATERCTGGTAGVSCLPRSGSVFPVGLTRVVCTAEAGDRRAKASFMINVVDDTPPQIQCPANLVVDAQSSLGAVVHYDVIADDDYSAQTRVRCSPPSGTVFAVGDTRVFCEAGDGRGNVSRCGFNVTVNPAQPLRIARLETNRVELRWTGDGALEATDSLGENSHWQEITDAPRIDGVERSLGLPASTPHRFFRTHAKPLLPPADEDSDGIPDSLDRCPGTPRGLVVDEHGCSLLEIVATPDVALGAERGALAQTVADLIFAGGFFNLAERLQSQLAPSNNPAFFLRSRDLAKALHAQSNLVSELRRALAEFSRAAAWRMAESQRNARILDAAHADVRPEDFEISDLGKIEGGLSESLSQGERTLAALTKLVEATAVRQITERARIVSFDNERGTAQLADGRLLLLPKKASDVEPSDQLPVPLGTGGIVQVEASQLPDGSWFGFELDPDIEVNPAPNLELDPTCLRLRIVPADPGLPTFDIGPRHHPNGYKWGYTDATSRYYVEEGMGLAVEKVNLITEAPGAYAHVLQIEAVPGSWYIQLNEDSAPYVIKTADFPSGLVNFKVREFRAPIKPDKTLGMWQQLSSAFYLFDVRPYASYAQAEYSRTIFQLEDWPNETHFESAQVKDLARQWPLWLQPLDQQTFTAQSYKVSGQSSSYPNTDDVHLYQSFAVHFQDPNNELLFAYTNDVGRGLYAPTINGFRSARPFTYRVGLPTIVRDRLHDCTGGIQDSYYRMPFLGPGPANTYGGWHVSQGNDGGFTHTNKQRYAFDFVAEEGLMVFACRGGIVDDAQGTASKSCWDPDFDNGPDQKDGACTGCDGDKSANFVYIRHQDGTLGVYKHFKMNGVFVKKGQRVYRGDAIGQVGTTGCSTDPHLHFDVRSAMDGSQTIPIRFECYDDDFHFRACYLPESDSDGFSTNKPWWWPY